MNKTGEDYNNIVKGAKRAAVTGGALAIGGTALAFVTMGLGAIMAGIGAAMAAAAAAGIWMFIQTLEERKVKQTMKTELEELENKMSPMINLLEKMFQFNQEILRDPTTPKHKVTALRECFDDCSRMCQTFNLTGKFSGTLAEMHEMLELLDEITKDKKDESANPTQEEKTKEKQKEEKIKKASEEFINETRKGINELQNTMNEINQLKIRISKSLNDND